MGLSNSLPHRGAAIEQWFGRAAAKHATTIAVAAAYSIVAIAIRMELAGFDKAPLRVVASAQNAFFDVALISALALISAGFTEAFDRRRGVARSGQTIFLIAGQLLVVFACINIQAVKMIGGPLTYQWLRYADLLLSDTSQAAVKSAFTWRFFLILLLANAGYLGLVVFFRGRLRTPGRRGAVLLVLGLGAILTFLIAASDRARHEADRADYLSNPVFELVASVMRRDASDLLHQTDAILPASLPPPSNDPKLLPVELVGKQPKNVIVVVMESVGANHVAGTGPPQARQWTPNLARYADRTLVFTNIYAHVAYSTKSMFSLLTARLPLFSIELESREFQTARMVGLVDRLKAKGYRTALFMSGDLAFQSVDKFVAKRGFDKIADINNIGCSGARYVGSTSEWRNLDTMDDRCTVKAVMSWFDQPSPQPSLAIFWTGNTHWPYFSKPEPRPGEFSQNERLNRYLGALRTSDAAIGAMLDELTRRKALDDTLVIVLGDHGEAFGEHGFKAHGNTVFEEEVHIPLLIINGAIKGRSFATLGALSDLSPTILHLIGADPEPSWDGRSLFDPNRSGQVMLFAPNHQLSVGFREKDRKYIYETNSGLSRVFDLTNDPAERNNIADRQSAAYARRRSAGWIIHQNQRAMELRRRV